MNRIIIAAIAILIAAAPMSPAEARVFVAVGVGAPCCGYYPAYPAYYAPYPAYYYAPPPALVADQASPTFVDASGRTCRAYQAVGGAPIAGTACLGQDGVWRSTGG